MDKYSAMRSVMRSGFNVVLETNWCDVFLHPHVGPNIPGWQITERVENGYFCFDDRDKEKQLEDLCFYPAFNAGQPLLWKYFDNISP